MDDILTDVNESWTAESNGTATGMQQFKGSDDYLRSKVRARSTPIESAFFVDCFRSSKSISKLRFPLLNIGTL